MFAPVQSWIDMGSVDLQTEEAWASVLCAFITVGAAVTVGWIMTKVMKSKQFLVSLPVILVLSGITALALYFRYGWSVRTAQGILLMLVLLYASCSDLTSHTMDDCLWVMVTLLGLYSISTVGLPSMLTGAVMVFMPQYLTALLSKKALGGADIKLSVALAFLLGWERGLAALIAGLLGAVIVMSIIQTVRKKRKKQPFALIPFLSVAAMAVFFI